MHFFAKKFAHVRKKQYFCTRFYEMTCFLTKNSYIVNRK